MKLDINTLLELHALYSDYAAALDARDLQCWPGFFTEDCIYKLQSRENFDHSLPLATMSFESRGRLQDCVYGAAGTIFHHLYVQCRIVGLPRLLARDDDVLRCEASYLVIRTPQGGMPEILRVGRTLAPCPLHTPPGARPHSCGWAQKSLPSKPRAPTARPTCAAVLWKKTAASNVHRTRAASTSTADARCEGG